MDDYMHYKMATEGSGGAGPGCSGPGCGGGCLPWLLATVIVLAFFGNCC